MQESTSEEAQTLRASTAGTLAPDQPRSLPVGLRWLGGLRWPEAVGMGAVLVLAAVLDFVQLNRDGFANTYYAAAVRSMSESWHNFFFSAYDPGGFVTIDKPPVGFWFQVLSVKLFGFHGVSLLLPQALAGVLSVAVVMYLVRRRFGPVAGLLAALALAVTPISVATNRNNTIDSLLALTLLLAACSATLAIERGRLRWLLLCLALVGVGFNIKMAEAFVALPAFVLAYFLAAPLAWRKRVLHLALAGVVLAVVSLSWVTTVDLIPATQRPYVGSSQHNSELELALGYNGINRLFPRRFFRGARPARPATAPAPAAPRPPQNAAASTAPRTPPAGFAGPGFGGQTSGIGGLLRLFGQQLAGQLSWLMPLAIIGLLIAAWQTWAPARLRSLLGPRDGPRDDSNEPMSSPSALLAERRQRARSVLLWGGWFLSGAILFTFDQAARPYYMVTLAPATAALVGIGAVALWQEYRRQTLLGWLLPVALLATAAVEVDILRPFPTWSQWITPVTLIVVGLAAAALLAVRLLPRLAGVLPIALGAAAAGVLALFLAPAVWSGVTVTRAAPGGAPSAGPSLTRFGFFGARAPAATQRAVPPGPDAQINVDPKLLVYLEQNYRPSDSNTTRFLVATPNAQTASPLIIKTGDPVMALGGFMGADPILTPAELAQDVQQSVVRYFLLPGASGTPSNGLFTGSSFGGQFNRGNAASRAASPGRGQPQAGTQASFGRRSPTSGSAAPSEQQAEPFPAPFAGGFGRANGLETWVTAHCSLVPTDDWRSTSTAVPSFGFGFGFGAAGQQLYDCGSSAGGA